MVTENKSHWTQSKTPFIALSCVTALSVFALIARPVQADETATTAGPQTEVVATTEVIASETAETANPMANVLSDAPSSTSTVASEVAPVTSETAISQPATSGTTVVDETASAAARVTTSNPTEGIANEDKVPDEAIYVTDDKPKPEEETDTETPSSEEKSTETNITGGHFYPDKEGNWHYKGKDGKDLVGPQTIGDNHYYFGDDGVQVKGDFAQDGHFYEGQFGHLVKDSFVTTGDNHWYYVDNNGNKLTGLQKIGENTYHFAEDGRQTKGNRVVIDGKGYYFHPENGQLGNNRLLEEGRFQYVNGTYDKIVYFYDDDGNRVEGARIIDGKEYYFLPRMAYLEKVKNPDGTESYYDESGTKVYKDWGKLRYMYLRGYLWEPKLYVDEKGHVVRGFKTIDGHLYYFDEFGSLRDDVPGNPQPLFRVDGNLYFADFHREHGDTPAAILTNQIFSYFRWGDWNKDVLLGTYLADETGKLTKLIATNQYVNVGDKWYYLDELGRVVTGDRTIDNAQVHFDKYGVQTRGRFADNGRYYDKESGALVQNQFVQVDGKQYYIGQDGKVANGPQIVDGKSYYIDKDGTLAKGVIRVFNDQMHFYDPDTGEQVTNRFVAFKRGQYIPESDFDDNFVFTETLHPDTYRDEHPELSLYYFGPEGVPLTGRQTINNQDYYFDKNGRAIINRIVGFDGKLYYYDTHGVMAKNKQVRVLLRYVMREFLYYYYFDHDGVGQEARNQLITKNYTPFYAGPDGKRMTITSRFISDHEGNWYYFDQDGHLAQGPQTIDSFELYFYPRGIQAKGQFVEIDGHTYYFDKDDGRKVKNASFNLNGLTYIADENGHISIKGDPAYRNIYLSDKLGYWYYYNDQGNMLIGSQSIDGVHVYFHNDGKQSKGELVTEDGIKRYYYYHNGARAENTTLTVKGVTYRFDQDGRGTIVS